MIYFVTDKHHILWQKAQLKNLGGEVWSIRDLPALVPQMDVGAHRELHRQIAPVNFQPREQARRIFRGVGDLAIQEMNTSQAVDALLLHLSRVQNQTNIGERALTLAVGLSENLEAQKPFLQDVLQKLLQKHKP